MFWVLPQMDSWIIKQIRVAHNVPALVSEWYYRESHDTKAVRSPWLAFASSGDNWRWCLWGCSSWRELKKQTCSWWFQPTQLKNMQPVKLGSFLPRIGVHIRFQTYLKPPPRNRFCFTKRTFFKCTLLLGRADQLQEKKEGTQIVPKNHGSSKRSFWITWLITWLKKRA